MRGYTKKIKFGEGERIEKKKIEKEIFAFISLFPRRKNSQVPLKKTSQDFFFIFYGNWILWEKYFLNEGPFVK